MPVCVKCVNWRNQSRISAQLQEKQVSVNVHFIPVPMMSFYVKQGYNILNYPTALSHFQCEISLPVWIDLTAEQLKQVTDAVITSVNEIVPNI